MVTLEANLEFPVRLNTDLTYNPVTTSLGHEVKNSGISTSNGWFLAVRRSPSPGISTRLEELVKV